MEPQRPSNSDPKSASLILKQLKEAAKAAEDVDDYCDTEEEEEEEDDDEEEEEEEEDEEEEIVSRFGFRVESNNDGKVTKKKKLFASGGSGKRGNYTSSGGGGVAPSCCQVEKCGADLTEAKRYYKRHKVCEAHAKSPLVVVDGIRQRFCQQCSRFHELSEFDEMRRSCRSRLAGHNERRRKVSSETHREDSSSSNSSRSQLKEIQRGQVDERGRITIAVPGKHIQIR